LGSVPPASVSRPNSNDRPESHDEPTVAHLGALSVVSKTAVCEPPDVATVREIVVERTIEPEVPVTVTVVGPIVAVGEAVKVKVEDALPLGGGVTGLVEKAAVTPLGRPETLSVVPELNPFTLLTVIMLFAFEPWTAVTVLGDAETEKPGAAAPTVNTRSS